LAHTADAKFRAYGGTLEEAFANAALALAALMWDWKGVEPRITITISIKGKDLPQLLFNFLEEVLFLLDTREFLLHGVDPIKIWGEGGDFCLEATFQGDEYSDKYTTYGDVKAITYHEMNIKQADKIELQVVVDM
jgi:SHS2 domain-containing protein